TTSITQLPNTQLPFSIYPNPANDFINISFTLREEKNVSVEIYDLFGREVFEKELQTSNSKLQTTLDVSFLSPAIYFIKVIVDGKSMVQKVVKM
ncbi:MAG: T9SS type A sorting domain-containing protein, partial [Bacteroidia bacterium]